MKCEKCIFAKDVDAETVKCCNPYSDKHGYNQFLKYDGCKDGKASTVGIDKLQRIAIMRMGE